MAVLPLPGVSTDYLMGLTETKNYPNTDLHDLHLSDDMITVLKSGKINNRLLCEMGTHKDFQRLMTDIEIYIDRIADMRINDLNAVLNAVRQQVIAQYDPGENDLNVRALELGQLGIDYDKLTREEFVTLIGILKKSKHMKSSYSQRSKGKRRKR